MSWDEEKERLGKEIIGILYDNGMIKTWYRDKPEGWVLISGIWSPFYIQLRPLSSYPNSKEILTKVGRAMGKMFKNEAPNINKLVGIAAAGVPIAVAITIFSGIPSCYTRKLESVRTISDINAKIAEYGEHSILEGEIDSGDVIAIVDDLVTRFDSKLIAFEQIKYEIKRREKLTGKKIDATCKDVVVLFDREQGAFERAKTYGMNLFSLIPFKSKGIGWLKGKMSRGEFEIIFDYLTNAEKYQNEKLKNEVIKLAKNARN